MTEVWKPIPSAKGWFASSEGRIWLPTKEVRMPNGGVKLLTVGPTFGAFVKATGRYTQSISGKTKPLAPLICEAFHGPRPSPRHHCMHLDEDRANNKETNLAWGTALENNRAPKFVEARRAFMLAYWAKYREEKCRDI